MFRYAHHNPFLHIYSIFQIKWFKREHPLVIWIGKSIEKMSISTKRYNLMVLHNI